ncbi:succinate-semialdehyde dehydrogenase/glutarate-semialdehyde dehydrogenase [Gelidibacter sediminis]|uniref:Succinate-semialdehyde dehydrogenase/glutarate-semialdehyde dehydrogenase n=1 Tax=Gelidibacter sediminis TaxID=1608710 RepID=A0A4R7PX79_9FLAO|nr:NAD-dependent succinate-semialdehyde dehydrogenase [Gelidibacter sediminis]TDU39563.1 succinate-semialdehyde dehydrogenase/glutarate-semialdehyde dehydrogenase [Gelidibacter sediminis]
MKNSIKTVNPYTNHAIKTYQLYDANTIDSILNSAHAQFREWRHTSIKERCRLLSHLAQIMEDDKQELAELISQEMGKPILQSISEIEKCQSLCDFYAVNADDFLADELIETEASESFISYDPLGVILAIMPWNYPFWQVMRFALPTITAGNTAILKHAANVTGCAIAIEKLFEKAGYPKGCFTAILADHDAIEKLIGNELIKAVTLTGSENAGKSIAATAGKHLKKTVLELGGNNACIILDDADLDTYMDTIVNARMQNAGQSCIAAKRFIVTEAIYDEFLDRFKEKVAQLNYGDPTHAETTLGPLAQKKFADTIKKQVDESVALGAKIVVGNTQQNAYFEPTILTEITEAMPVFKEEVFGPVAPIMKAKNADNAFEIASNSRFGLGTMVFTQSIELAQRHIATIDDGAYFINELVKSDPRLPFGGTKASGYGRELSKEGIQEFVNKKTVYINH